MATENTKTEALSVESRLKSLYELQTILTEIDRIKTIRGELPLEVKDLEDNLAGLHTRIENYKAEIAALNDKLVKERQKIADSQSKIATYKEQLDNVRNNREFDLLTQGSGVPDPRNRAWRETRQRLFAPDREQDV